MKLQSTTNTIHFMCSHAHAILRTVPKVTITACTFPEENCISHNNLMLMFESLMLLLISIASAFSAAVIML